MKGALQTRTLSALSKVYELATTEQLASLRYNLIDGIEVVQTLAARSSDQARHAERFLAVMHTLLETLPERAQQLSVEGRGSADHDYGNFLKLCRSVHFSWGPWSSQSWSGAFSPHLWAMHEVLARSGPNDAFSLLEVGVGTGSAGYELAMVRPKAHIIQAELALESLVMGVLIQNGEALHLPRRVAFEVSEDGVGWFDLQVPATPKPITHLPIAQPEPGQPFDMVLAINALSLAPDPRQAVKDLARHVRPGGLFVWVDLLCWRLETPAPRRLEGVKDMLATVEAAGLQVTRQVSGIPYTEDWGFERQYQWTSHAVIAQRP
jgi:SAM-dependent methyltransferase